MKPSKTKAGRILGTRVQPLFPETGEIRVMLYGEAPGPRGADQSGIPFWGDHAGIIVYRALVENGRADVPEEAWGDWDGARFRELGLKPQLRAAVLGNAWPWCPTNDGDHFRAPTNRELGSLENLARLHEEITRAIARCEGHLRVIAMGKRAEWVFTKLKALDFEFHTLPHPSAQGLLQSAPNQGRGLKLEDLRRTWESKLSTLLCR
jgi:uracil-DNA glycosylase